MAAETLETSSKAFRIVNNDSVEEWSIDTVDRALLLNVWSLSNSSVQPIKAARGVLLPGSVPVSSLLSHKRKTKYQLSTSSKIANVPELVRNRRDHTILGFGIGNGNVLEQVGVVDTDFDTPLVEAGNGTKEQEREPIGAKAGPQPRCFVFRQIRTLQQQIKVKGLNEKTKGSYVSQCDGQIELVTNKSHTSYSTKGRTKRSA